MTDEIISELWKIKDNIASEHNYDLNSLVTHLRSKRGRTVDPKSLNMVAEQDTPANSPSRAATEDS